MTKASDNPFPSILVAEQGSAPTTPASGFGRIYCKSDGLYFVGDNGTEIGPLGTGGAASNLDSASYTRTSGNYSTNSTTFVDVDATNLALTIMTGARRVMVTMVGVVSLDIAPSEIDFDVDLDGTRLGGLHGIIRKPLANTQWTEVGFVWITDALTAGSHTFKLQWKTGQTATMRGDGAGSWKMQFSVVELLAG